mmetsp:Transcript_31362/g.88958  ORF Transcript_31362/g.88958 Transcript_31362/m.88958 type:complete len:569 (+) Transcript_31362:37-1743(+)
MTSSMASFMKPGIARSSAPGTIRANAAPRPAARVAVPKAAVKLAPAVDSRRPLGFVDGSLRLRASVRSRNVTVASASAAAAAPPPAPAPPPSSKVELKPMKWKEALASVAIGLIIRFVIPCPAGITMQAWSLLSIFIATIAGIVLNPLPVGAWAFFGLTATVFTKTLTFQQAFGAFTNDVIWLIVIIFFIARGFVKTGLGDRAGYLFAKAFGKTTLGLAYALTATEALICPGMPSTTARHGGVMLPIIASLSRACGSDPANGTQNKMGAYLVTTILHTGGITSALFMTGAAQNLLCNKLAGSIGVPMSTWGSWFQASCVPGIISLVLTPYVLYKLFPPEIKETPNAPAEADAKLKEMGPVSLAEKIVLGVMGALVLLWICGSSFGVAAPVAGMLGLCTLVGTGVLTWQDCLQEKGAWDTLTWFAILVGMSGQLNGMGVITCFADAAGSVLQSLSMGWPAVFGVLHVFYFVIHYMFASQTAHVGALYSAFIAMMLASGVPPVLAALSLAFNTNLFGVITHYSSGQAAVFCGAGYLQLKDVFRIGAIFSAFNAVLWATVGMAWWKVVGLY